MTWFVTIIRLFFLHLALLVMTVGMKFFSGRTIHMIGGTALCLSYVISSRAEDVRVLLLSHGVIQGRHHLAVT